MSKRYGRYEVLYKLGQGAMAQVYLARDPVLNRFVAIKVLHAELATRKDVLQRFFNEARTVAMVRNPHVVEVFDFGQEGSDLFLVMEFVDGISLHGILKQLHINSPLPDHSGNHEERGDRQPLILSEPMDAMVAASVVCQAAAGLSIAEQYGVVHRDIKPENLMIDQRGRLKIADFGIAHVQAEQLTQTGAILGSPLFMSPEQARGAKPITSQADMFSLGAVFYRCLAGHPPFQGRSLTEIFRKISEEPHEPIWKIRPELDPALVQVVELLLNKRPAQRGGGALWLHRHLKGYLAAAGGAEPEEALSAYMRELSARGVQTTWTSDPPTAAAAMTELGTRTGTRPNMRTGTSRTLRYNRESRPVKKKRRILTALLVGLTLLTGIWFWRGAKASDRKSWRSISRHFADSNSIHVGLENRNPGLLEPNPVNQSGAATGGAFQESVRESEGQKYPEKQDAASSAFPGIDASQARFIKSGKSDVAGEAMAMDSARRVSNGPGIQVLSDSNSSRSTLSILSSPPFAEVYLDDSYLGVTPVTARGLSVGRHRVLLMAKHAHLLDTSLEVHPGPQTVKLHMEEATARLAGGDDDSE